MSDNPNMPLSQIPVELLRLLDAEIIVHQDVPCLVNPQGQRYFILQGIPILLKDPYPYLIGVRNSTEEQLSQLGNYLRSDVRNLWWVEAHRERLERRLRDIYRALAQASFPVAIRPGADSQLDSRYETELNTDIYTHIAWAFQASSEPDNIPNDMPDEPFPDAGELYAVQQQLMQQYLPSDGVAVDIGCGVGRNIDSAAQIATQGLAIGVDLSLSKLERARAVVHETETVAYPNTYRHTVAKAVLHGHGLANSAFVLGNGGNLPFLDASVDCITCSYVIGVVADPFALIRHAVRMLKPGGVLIIADSLDGSGQMRFTISTLVEALTKQFPLMVVHQDQCTYLECISYTRTVSFLTHVVVARKTDTLAIS